MIIKTTLGMSHSVSEGDISKFQIRTKQEHFKAETLPQNKNIRSQINVIVILPQRASSWMLQQS